jgi:aflatoxin B1 aldehyde reductase
MDGTVSILEAFAAGGHTELDTARVYLGGEQEPWTASALTHFPENTFTVATKLMPQGPYNHTPAVLRSALEASMSALQTSQVELFYLHAADRNTPIEITMEAVNQLHKEGKFKSLGISNYSAYEVAEICMLCRERGWVRPSVFQARYNILSRGIEKELIHVCKRWGIDVVVYSPLAGGLLSGKYTADTIPTDDSRFSDKHTVGRLYIDRFFKPELFRAVSHLSVAAENHGLTMLEIALRWLVHHSALVFSKDGGNDGVIIGCSSLEQLRGNLEDLEKGPLPEEVVKACEEAWAIAMPAAPG